MYFNFNIIQNFLFYGVSIITPWNFVSVCIGLILLVIILDALRFSHKLLNGTSSLNITDTNEQAVAEKTPLIFTFFKMILLENHNPQIVYVKKKSVFYNKLCYHLTRTAIYTLTVLVNYIIMLSVMSFNGYLFISAVIGAGLGYFFLPFETTEFSNSAKTSEESVLLQQSPRQYGATSNANMSLSREAGTCAAVADASGPIATTSDLNCDISKESPNKCYFYAQSYEKEEIDISKLQTDNFNHQ